MLGLVALSIPCSNIALNHRTIFINIKISAIIINDIDQSNQKNIVSFVLLIAADAANPTQTITNVITESI
jgi:hypothetical protein